jgi:hypothetical protein
MTGTVFGVVRDILQLLRIGLRSRIQLAAENLVFRKQLALYDNGRAEIHYRCF